MKFVTSDASVSIQKSVYSKAAMNTGEVYCGAIIVDVPLYPHVISVDDTISFSQQPHKILKFGDCEHYKIQGTVYQPSNGGFISASSRKSVFGPTYDQEGVGHDIVARTTTSYESWQGLYGNFNNNQTGLWYFAIAAKRIGNLVFQALGAPDLQGSRRYPGRYSFQLHEFRANGLKVEHRSVIIFDDKKNGTPRTSTVRPFEAIDLFREKLLSLIQSAEWFEWNRVYYMSSIDPQSIRYPSFQQIFPYPDMKVRWGELAADAYNSVPFFSSNGIAYANDLRNLKKSADQTLSLIKSFGNIGKYATKIAQLFLSFHYGWKLFVSDTQELYQSIEKRNHSRNYLNRATSQQRWEAHGASYLATFQCYYNRYANATQLDRFILDNDLALTPENLWDLIPFSFVVDWFTGIGKVLESASSYYTFTQKHEVLCSGRSIKATKDICADKLHPGWQGTITCSYYRRVYTQGAYRPTFSFSNSVNPLDHLIEGSALIVSRR